MKRKLTALSALMLALSSVLYAAATADVNPSTQPVDQYVLENASLARTFSTANGSLHTVSILNKLSNTAVAPGSDPEFRLRLSQGTDHPETAYTLTAADFKITKIEHPANAYVFDLDNQAHKLNVEVRYELAPGDFYLRKRLTITSGQAVTLERIDVESLGLEDAYQPYTVRDITAKTKGRWSPGLGQPLYGKRSGTFWGIEFPAADNQVKDGMLQAGYLWGRQILPGQPYHAYPAVMGVSDDPAFVADAFLNYIDRIRIRPLRLSVQYNTWFDYGHAVTKEDFAKSVAKIHHELVDLRGNRPLSTYVIDDGWEDVSVDWSDKLWAENSKFDPDFASSRQAVAAADGHLGLWLSPGCLFGAHSEVAKLRAHGFEAMDDWMSMAGPRYMQALEDRMVELTRQGVCFFKLDGVFGHLNLRNFEIHGEKYGIPAMPQLGLGGFTAGDVRLNDPRYDELKIYYLTAGTERLMQIFDKLATVNPDIYLLISNGAYISPWWLMHVDTVWMINAGDGAPGANRTDQLVYRDGRYYEIFHTQNTQYPISGIFNHEPKKVTTGESKDAFRNYLYMHLSRGTGFVELYLKPSVLQSGDWDVLSEGLHWANEVFPTFKHVRMHGGNPTALEVYGYTGWTPTQGYISIHNPSAESRDYSLKLDREFGLFPGNNEAFHISSPLDNSTRGLPIVCHYGDTLTFRLDPHEVRIINFSTKPQDWTTLKKLQSRSPENVVPEHGDKK